MTDSPRTASGQSEPSTYCQRNHVAAVLVRKRTQRSRAARRRRPAILYRSLPSRRSLASNEKKPQCGALSHIQGNRFYNLSLNRFAATYASNRESFPFLPVLSGKEQASPRLTTLRIATRDG